MHAPSKLVFALILLSSFLLNAGDARALTNLGWHTFDYGTSVDLGQRASIFDGALELRGRSSIASLYDCSGSLFEGTASNLFYLHDENWLVGGMATSAGGVSGATGLASELLFEFSGSARLDSMALTISGLSFGSAAYDISGFNQSGDDSLLWFNTNHGFFTISEQELSNVTSFFIDGTLAGAQNGYVDFAYFTTKMGADTMVSSFGLRETKGEIWVKDLYVGDYYAAAPVPEPGSLLLMASGLFFHLRRRRTVPLSSRLAVG